ncbi:MAG: hypothetical protein IPP52_19040 [Ignavibacteria bacterium]|nr:hypothetical protein [Ignavibacteria bacterium]
MERFKISEYYHKGTLKVYILNTTDTAYNKGTNFTTAISGMTKIIDDSIAVLSGLGPFTINVPVGGPGTSSFVTTSGQGIYIAFEYKTTSTLATPSGSPTISCNNSLTHRGGTYQSQSANGTTLTLWHSLLKQYSVIPFWILSK